MLEVPTPSFVRTQYYDHVSYEKAVVPAGRPTTTTTTKIGIFLSVVGGGSLGGGCMTEVQMVFIIFCSRAASLRSAIEVSLHTTVLRTCMGPQKRDVGGP